MPPLRSWYFGMTQFSAARPGISAGPIASWPLYVTLNPIPLARYRSASLNARYLPGSRRDGCAATAPQVTDETKTAKKGRHYHIQHGGGVCNAFSFTYLFAMNAAAPILQVVYFYYNVRFNRWVAVSQRTRHLVAAIRIC